MAFRSKTALMVQQNLVDQKLYPSYINCLSKSTYIKIDADMGLDSGDCLLRA